MRPLLFTCALVAILLAPVAAQNGNATWTAWARANHYGLAAIESREGDTFPDLGFLRQVLGDRRIVQMGESGHGVAEFNEAKVRLIKFLHQQMGFDVIAFESGMLECFNADRFAADAAATDTMRRCIFGVWHTSEVLPLFEYIRSTKGTARPLTLAGFDTQLSSFIGNAGRPAFMAAQVAAIDPARGAAVEAEDIRTLQALTSGTSREYAKANEARLSEFYGGLELSFREHRTRLTSIFGDPLPRIAERAAWSTLRYLEQLRASLDRPNDAGPQGGGAIRDAGMAENVTVLANDLYPGRKIMIWAHNFHIRHDNAATNSVQVTMGKPIRDRFRDQLYTIGLYMNRGSAATNDRTVYSISPAPVNSMEWVLASAGSPALFIDFLHHERSNGNSWMFQSSVQREWGVNSFPMIPRNQYDGVLFIDQVRSPSYLRFTN